MSLSLVAPAFICVLVLSSCISATTPHQNFLSNLQFAVGTDIRGRRDFTQYVATVLPNGHIEYRYTQRYPPGRGLCTTIYEVDPSTYRILRADYLGTSDDCVIQP